MSQRGWSASDTVAPAPGVNFGGFWIRVVAAIIDAIVLMVLALILSSMFASLYVLVPILGIAYLAACWGLLGQTVGMMPFGLRVVRNIDGGRLTWANVLLRMVGCIPAGFLALGYISAAFDHRKRGWHDMIGGTVVIKNG
jgi:uncharacterized RDD family membrane protein YckC